MFAACWETEALFSVKKLAEMTTVRSGASQYC